MVEAEGLCSEYWKNGVLPDPMAEVEAFNISLYLTKTQSDDDIPVGVVANVASQ